MEYTAVGKGSEPHVKFYLVLIKKNKNSDSVLQREAPVAAVPDHWGLTSVAHLDLGILPGFLQNDAPIKASSIQLQDWFSQALLKGSAVMVHLVFTSHAMNGHV